MIRTLYFRFLDWFEQPESPKPLAWLRISVALFCMVNLFVIRHSFLEIYGQYGFVQWAITRANLYYGLPHLGDVALWLGKFGLTPHQSLYFVLAVYLAGLCGLLLGWATRCMAILVWLIHFLWMHAGGGLIYGMDVFTHIALFYCMFMPVGEALSMDLYLGGRQSQPSTAAGVTRKMLQFHMCIIYLSSGFEKASGIQWWNGEAIWRSLLLPTFRQFDMHWLAYVPWVAMAMGWSILLIEVGYAFFIWWRKTRWIWLLLTVGMHFFVGVFLGMWLFGTIMIVLNLGAFGYDAVRDRKEILHLSLVREHEILRGQ